MSHPFLLSNQTPSQLSSLSSASSYLQSHRILELFHELLAKIIIERPSDVQKFLYSTIEEMLSTKKNTSFLGYKDFDAMFETYNILSDKKDTEKKEIPIEYLLQGLSLVGVQKKVEEIWDKYGRLNAKNEVNKTEFIEVMVAEYMARITPEKI